MKRRTIGLHPAFLRFSATLTMLFSGTLAFSALAFLTQVILTRQLPIAEVGPIAALLAVINFLTPVATAGINYFILQSFGREGWGAMRWLPRCAQLAGLATLLTVFALAGYMLPRATGAASLLVLLLTSTPILLGQLFVELASARLQLEGRYGILSAWQGITQGGRFAVILITEVMGASMGRILGGYALVGLASTLLGLGLLRGLWRGQVRLASLGDAPRNLMIAPSPPLGETARGSLPFALMTMFYVAYFQGPVVILEWLRGGTAAGAYNSAFLIIAAMSVIPTVIYMKFLLPKICRWAEHDRSAFSAAFHVGVPAMLVCGLCLMGVVIIAAPMLVPKLFGEQYAAGVPALMILAFTIPVRFVQSVYSSLFIRGDEMVRKIRYLGISAVVGGLSCLALIPVFGLRGAALATLLAEVSLLVLHIDGTARFIEGINIADTMRIGTFVASLRQLLHGRYLES
ncbi:MAG TPA: polysaccharide biosynthesis C-terminal domain-containing protein [Rhodopila sp.]|nr:polysaccharide biosynthesis C-terminal domain-containing protein [Rhodopila sp.]